MPAKDLFDLNFPNDAWAERCLVGGNGNPAQPALVWQIYDYSLEPFGSFFGVQKASEQVHIMMTLMWTCSLAF